MSVGSVGFYAQLSAKNKAIGGLASGLDTDALVEALTLATRTKLATQGQKKTLLGWKTAAYRSVASTLRSFQDNRISMAAGVNSLKSQAFFNTFKGTSSSDKITATPGTGATPGTFTVEQIKQLATTQTLTTDKFTHELEGENIVDLTGDYIGKTLQLQMGATTKTIKLDTLQGKTGAAAFQSELQSLINKAFGTKDAAGTQGYITASMTETSPGSGQYKIALEGGTSTVTVRNNADLLGLKSGMSNRISTSSTITELLGALGSETLKFSINDTVITVNANDSISLVMTKINNSNAGVHLSFDSASESFVFTSKVTGAGDNIVMQDVQGNFLNKLVGAQGGNSFAATMKYTDATQSGSADLTTIASSTDFSAYKMKLTIGSASIDLTLDVSAFEEDIANGDPTREKAIEQSLNKQIEAKFGKNTGVSFELKSDNTISLKSERNDQLVKIEDVGAEPKALDLLGLSAKENVAFTSGFATSVKGGAISDLDTLLGDMEGETYTLNVTIGGVTKELSVQVTQEELDKLKPTGLTEGTTEYNAQLLQNQRNFLASKLNGAKSAAFDSTTASKVFFSINSDNEVVVRTTDDNIRFSIAKETAATHDLFGKLGFSGAVLTNYTAGSGTLLSDFADANVGTVLSFTLGGTTKTVTLTGGMSIQDLVDKVNSEMGRELMSFQNGSVVIDGGTQTIAFSEGAGSTVLKTLFGHSSYATASAAGSFATKLADGMGQNAEIVVNGETLWETSNTFNINGCAFTVNDTTEPGEKAITVSVTSNPDDVVDKLKSFIEDYNTLVDALNTLVKETKVAGYTPLTDEQRAEMTEDQIKQWENEAKKGLLYNDSTIRGIMQEMRTALYSSVEAAGISLYDIGITTESFSTSSSYVGNGRLEMTEDGEKKLRAMLTTNPDAVRNLFTDSQNGLAVQLDNIVNNAIRVSVVNPGSLVSLAGTSTSTTNTYSIGRQVETIDKQIALLKTRLENEYNRYWKKFTALETAISNMNTQSSWLADFGS